MTISRRKLLTGAGATIGLGALSLSGCKNRSATLSTNFDAEVLILGAGLSGLYAATLLTDDGRDSLVLEGANRVGGRLHTLEHASGYTEGGGEQVGASYARIRNVARKVGVDIRPDTSPRRDTAYWINGQLLTSSEWAAQNPAGFPDAFAGATPGSPLFRLAAANNPLQSADAWQEAEFTSFDISAAAFLQQAGFAPKARSVMERALNGNALSSYSMMNLYRSLQLYTQDRSMGPSGAVVGGAQRLPEAMAENLPRAPQLGIMIRQITVHDSYVEATDHTGRIWRAPHMICTLPFGALRHIRIDAPLLPAQRAAILALPYTQIFQVHFRATSPFWEVDDRPADMWTDSPIERVFANRDEQGRPTGMFRSWINGAGTTLIKRASTEETKTNFLSELARIRPSTSGHIDILSLVDWTGENRLAGGAYMHWAPGQIRQWARPMAEPVGRLHFAGEHLGHLHTGMEAAMESAERAALRLMGF